MLENKDVIQEALKTIQELDRLYDSNNPIVVNQHCNRLSNLSVNVGKLTSDAEKLLDELEAEYDNAVEKKKLELIESGVGVGKAESMAKVELFNKKKDSLLAKDGYKRLDRFLKRIDKVLDSNKQYCATLKKTDFRGGAD